MKIREKLKDYKKLVDLKLRAYCESAARDDTPPWVRAATYSLLGGGKRIRPILAILASQVFNQNIEPVLSLACAIEMIHTYSLIHDDLPALDNDDLRRGRHTCHKAFDVPTAMWTGNMLLIQAFEIVMNTAQAYPQMRAKIVEAGYFLFRHAGLQGMVGGQWADLKAESKKVSLEELEFIHHHKTGALIMASVNTGASLWTEDQSILNAFRTYGIKIGLAFQVIDDLLDIQSETETLGKNVGSDLVSNKATYPALIGEKKSKEYAWNLVNEARYILHELEEFPTTYLEDLAIYIYNRKM